METNEKLFTKGFNNGYLLAQHEPELAKKLTANNNDQSDYFKGLVKGKKEFEMSKIRDHILGVKHQTPSPNTPAPDQTKSKGRGK